MDYRSRKDDGYSNWGKFGPGYDLDDDYDHYGYGRPQEIVDVAEALKPVTERLREYDMLRLKLESRGGTFSDLDRIAETLTAEIVVTGRFGVDKGTLADQASLKSVVRTAGNYDFHVDVRQLETRMPVYYLCRTRSDYSAEYGVIVEDLYKSPGYPFADDRFVRLMRGGHEVFYLRLSQFREAVTEGMEGQDSRSFRRRADRIIFDLGSHVFQAAWHEDQRLALAAASHFEMPRFREAVELLYLCLSGELCELRAAASDEMKRFFEHIYPQAAVRAFLDVLARLDGRALTDLPQEALKLYMRLSKAFSRFLATEATWGSRRGRARMYELLFGNFSRLHLVEKGLAGNQKIAEAATSLDRESQRVVDELLSRPEENFLVSAEDAGGRDRLDPAAGNDGTAARQERKAAQRGRRQRRGSSL